MLCYILSCTRIRRARETIVAVEIFLPVTGRDNRTRSKHLVATVYPNAGVVIAAVRSATMPTRGPRMIERYRHHHYRTSMLPVYVVIVRVTRCARTVDIPLPRVLHTHADTVFAHIEPRSRILLIF